MGIFRGHYFEYAAVADLVALHGRNHGRKYLYVPPVSVKLYRGDIQFQSPRIEPSDFFHRGATKAAKGRYPYGNRLPLQTFRLCRRNIDRIAGIEHYTSGRYISGRYRYEYRASHREKVELNLSLNIPGEYGGTTLVRLLVTKLHLISSVVERCNGIRLGITKRLIFLNRMILVISRRVLHLCYDSYGCPYGAVTF